MLFNSYTFLLGFAPIAFLGFFLLGIRHRRLAAGWLALLSIVFYGWWNAYYVPILLLSVVFNYCAGVLISRCRIDAPRARKALLILAVGVDLIALGYFKYADFLISNLSALSGLELTMAKVALPLGISFFTFTQIAYLVDTYKQKVKERNFIHYLLFVTYFPHLIAGPIIHHKDVMPQFATPDTYRFSRDNFVIGSVVFVIGLFKKCFLADGVAVFAAPVFLAAEHGTPLSLIEAWGGALAYTFQLYFDFSGYSDMAVGLSLMLNVRLPLNFNSPYKARNIVDFWKRWHISLSTFLRDYLYIPLGGNRHGESRRFVNLFLTMLIGGLWHGAGWTFVVWGGLHGLYLVVNHGWRSSRGRLPFPAFTGEAFAGAALTFFAVVVAWVFFRATSFHGAMTMLEGMAGVNGIAAPADAVVKDLTMNWIWCATLLAVTTFLPNTQEFVAQRFADKWYFSIRPHARDGAVWNSPGVLTAIGMGMLAAFALMNLSQPSEFLYFNF